MKSTHKQLIFKMIISILPWLISLMVILLFIIKWNSIKNFLVLIGNSNVIGALTGLLSIILSSFAVFYGRKAYLVALDIYERGVNTNKEKVLDQLGLELVIDLFIPLSKLNTGILGCQKNGTEEVLVSDLYSVIKNNKLSNKFEYFESHKSDVWDSLTICQNQTQEEAFSMICKMSDLSFSFQGILNDVIIVLGKHKDNNTKLQDLFSKSIITHGKVSDIQKTIRDLSDFENKLPVELGIVDKKNRMYRDLT